MKLKTCKDCNGKCCRQVVVELPTPKTIEDLEEVKWYVCHKNVNVFVESDGTWNVEFITPCNHLDKNNRCKIYQRRSKTCREHLEKDCEMNNPYTELFIFKKIEDVEDYIDKIFKKGLHNKSKFKR